MKVFGLLLLLSSMFSFPSLAVDEEYERIGRKYFAEDIRKTPASGVFEDQDFKPNLAELYVLPGDFFSGSLCPASQKQMVLVLAQIQDAETCKITFDKGVFISDLPGSNLRRAFYFPVGCVAETEPTENEIDLLPIYLRYKAESFDHESYDSFLFTSYTLEMKRTSADSFSGFARVLPFTRTSGAVGPSMGTRYHMAGHFTGRICNLE